MEAKNADREQVLHLLEEEGGVTGETVRKVSKATGVPEADVWGTGLFYTLLRGEPGQIRACQGLTCKMAGSDQLMVDLRAEGKDCIGVSCLGQCDRAPVFLDAELELASPDRNRGVSPSHEDQAIDLAAEDDQSYAGLAKARELGSEAVIEQVDTSGLQGRGGAGFPAGFKWKSVFGQADTERYLVCNADEGEPGTFKDREIMKRRPHRLIEGMAIAAATVSASKAYIYIRGEFMHEIRTLKKAIAEAEPHLDGLEFEIITGHGAYICGEETALLEAMEGKRGMPRLKPPFPTEQGFRSKPTLMHNVETLACLPALLTKGAEWFKSRGRTEAGPKIYCLSGHVKVPGVYELPLGVSLNELVEHAGGYEGTPLAFSPGGASAGFLPMDQADLALDFKSLAGVGSMLGSAGVVVLNDTVDLADAAAWQAQFFEDESCGQCAPCRIGTRYLRQALDRYRDSGEASDLVHVKDVAWEMEEGSICGLGIAAPLPLTSAIQHFPEHFAARRAGGSTESPS
ncbi:MAG: NADH-ubiquinone oxidoreductase-F iron-sulfur binding region domain-containing protein [Acidobacteriota bacterium]